MDRSIHSSILNWMCVSVERFTSGHFSRLWWSCSINASDHLLFLCHFYKELLLLFLCLQRLEISDEPSLDQVSVTALSDSVGNSSAAFLLPLVLVLSCSFRESCSCSCFSFLFLRSVFSSSSCRLSADSSASSE